MVNTPKKKVGRPPKEYVMTNGSIAPETLFLYVPRSTIPGKEVNRFLQLCDEQIKELNIDELTRSDVDEIAQYNRTRMLKDHIIGQMTNPVLPDGVEANVEQFTDLGYVTQLEKLHKQMNTHAENLKVRRKDRHTGKVGAAGKSLSDLARELDQEPQIAKKVKKEADKALKEYTEEFENSDPLKFIDNMNTPNK